MAWLSSMATRVFLLLLVGIIAAAAVAFAMADVQRRDADARARVQRLADRVVDLEGVLDRAPRDLRLALLGVGPEAARPAQLNFPSGAPDDALTLRLAARLRPAAQPQAFASEPEACRLAPSPEPRIGPPPPAAAGEPTGPPPPPPPPPLDGRSGPPAPTCRLIAFTLSDGQRERLILPSGPPPHVEKPLPFSSTMLGVVAAIAAALAYLTARFATSPLRRLASAAAALGADLDRPPLSVEGPIEVRQAAAAFNAMQADLRRRQAERTHMLAAITHDLQTPLTRLRLRMEKVADEDLRAQLVADQVAMVELVREGLDLARASHRDGEAPQELDVDSLLESLCSDSTEAGAAVEVTRTCACAVHTHPQALKRCVANLLDNALKYAGAAELEAVREQGTVTLRVLDRGPGIPSSEMAKVFEPFYRLEMSRSRDSGGAGLGLTIARLLAERAGGRLALAERLGGGLEANVSLPSC